MNQTVTRRQQPPAPIRCRGNTVEEALSGPSRSYDVELRHGLQRARALLVVAGFWALVAAVVGVVLWLT